MDKFIVLADQPDNPDLWAQYYGSREEADAEAERIARECQPRLYRASPMRVVIAEIVSDVTVGAPPPANPYEKWQLFSGRRDKPGYAEARAEFIAWQEKNQRDAGASLDAVVRPPE